MKAEETTEPNEAQRRELRAIDAALSGREVDPDLAELAALAAALRDQRVEPDAEAAEHLNARVALSRSQGGARLLGGWRSLRSLRPGRALAGAGAAATVAIAIGVGIGQVGGDGRPDPTGVPGDGGGGATQGVQDVVAEEAPSSAAEADDGRGGAGAQTAYPRNAGGPVAAGRANRRQDRDTAMTLSTEPDEVRRVATEVVTLTRDLDGIVFFSRVSDDAELGATANLRLKIPAPRLDDAVTQLSELASVESLSESVRDITGPFVSARQRLRDAREQRERLLERLGDATEELEIEAIRRQLRAVRNQIAAARASVDRIARRAQLADLRVDVVGNGEGADGDWGIGDAADDAVGVLRVLAGATIVALAVVVPLAGLIALAWLLSSRWTRRQRERALDARERS